MTIGDLVDLGFIETLLLRDREADVPSIPAIGDSSVAQPHCLFARMIEHPVRPELPVQPAEGPSDIRRMSQDRAEGGRLAVYGACEAWRRSHQESPSGWSP